MGFDRIYCGILELARPWNPEIVLFAWHEICKSNYRGLLGQTLTFSQVS